MRGSLNVHHCALSAAAFLLIAGTTVGADEPRRFVVPDHRGGRIIAQGTPGAVLQRHPLDWVGPPERASGVAYSALDAGSGLIATSPATGTLGVEDYGSILSASGPPNGTPTAQFDTMALSEFQFIGGADQSGGILYFDFYFNDFSLANGFGTQFPSAGSFIWTISIPETIQVPTEGYVVISTNTNPNQGPVTSGQWYLSDAAPSIGINDLAWDAGQFDYGEGPVDISYRMEMSAETSESFFGMPHAPLGQATLGSDGSGNLTVSNIGSSGDDGVEISPGELGGFLDMTLSSDPADVGDQFQFRLIGDLDGTPDQVVGHVTADMVSDGMGGVTVEVTPDFSALGAATYQVWAANLETNEFAQLAVGALSGASISFPKPATVTAACPSKCRRGLVHPHKGPFLIAAIDPAQQGLLTIEFDSALPVQIGMELPVMADLIVVTPENTSAGTVVPKRLRATVSGAPEFTISGETVGPFRLFRYGAVGSAELTAATDELTVSNIGSSGEDGVSIDVTETGSGGEYGAGFNLLPVDLGGAGTALGAEADGVFDGAPSSLGSIELANNGSAIDLSADYGAIGSTNVLVEVYNDGALVGSQVVSGGGVIGTLESAGSGLPSLIGCGKRRRFPVCFTTDFDRDGLFTPIGARGGMIGDEVHILAANPSGVINSLSTYRILGTGLGTLTFTGDSVPPPPCPGDVNGDGHTDVFDAAIVTARFGQYVLPNSNGDLDGSAFVDVLDFGAFAADFGCDASAP